MIATDIYMYHKLFMIGVTGMCGFTGYITTDGKGSEYKENKMKAVITDTEVMGNENNLYFQFGGCQAVARVSKYEISQVGDEIEFVFMPSKIHFFDKETEMNYL